MNESTQEATTLALQLSEKYHDFLSLIAMCKNLQDDQRLHSYIYKFEKENFGEFLFKYYLDKGTSALAFL